MKIKQQWNRTPRRKKIMEDRQQHGGKIRRLGTHGKKQSNKKCKRPEYAPNKNGFNKTIEHGEKRVKRTHGNKMIHGSKQQKNFPVRIQLKEIEGKGATMRRSIGVTEKRSTTQRIANIRIGIGSNITYAMDGVRTGKVDNT